MPTYQTPGVYIEELPAPQTIEGVSTSTAGFVGLTTKGPSLGNRLITSFTAFQRIFGGYLDESWGDARYLAFSVDGFFRNGGNLAYVARVVGDGATAAQRSYRNGFNTRLATDTAAEQAARDTVRLTSLFGIDVGDRLIFTESFAGVAIIETRRVVRYDAQTRRVWLEAALAARFTAARCVVTQENVAAPEPGVSEPRLVIHATSEGLWGNALAVEVAPSYGAGAITRAAAVDFSTTLLPRPLAFVAAGPAQGAVEADLADATAEIGDVLRFTNPGGDSVERLLIAAEEPEDAPGTTHVVWERPLEHAYDAAGSTVERVSRVLEPAAPQALAFAADGPAAEAASIEVVSAAGIVVGDVVEFHDPAAVPPLMVRRVVTSIDADNSEIGFDALGEAEDFSGPGTTALWIASPRARVASTVELATELAAAEAAGRGPVVVRVRQGGWSQILEVQSIDGEEVIFNGATRPVIRAFAASEAGQPTVLERALAGRAGNRNLDLGSAANLYAHAVIEIDDATQKTYHRVEAVDGNTLTLVETLTAGVPGGVTVRVVELSIAVEEAAGASELFEGLSLDPAAERFAPTVIGRGSRLITVAIEGDLGPLPFDLPQVRWSLLNATPPADPSRLTGGSDGGLPSAGAYIGRDGGPGQRTGIAALADQDDVALVAVPGVTDPDVQIALLDHCALLKSRFAILDSARGSRIGTGGADDVVVQRSQFDSLYGAIYFPWLRTRNPLDDDDSEGILVPPSGHVVGICARVDQERGVHKAPANETVRGITEVELKVSDREQAVLNPAAVNVIRDFRDKQRGLRVYGTRVLTTNVAWRYVPVRRLAIFIEQSLNVGLQWVVFEPNAEPLWAKVRRTVENFLTVVWRNGALEGVTPDEAFQVQCGRGTMSPDDIATGRLIVVVGFAPVRPAEFVIIRVFQKTREAA